MAITCHVTNMSGEPLCGMHVSLKSLNGVQCHFGAQTDMNGMVCRWTQHGGDGCPVPAPNTTWRFKFYVQSYVNAKTAFPFIPVDIYTGEDSRSPHVHLLLGDDIYGVNGDSIGSHVAAAPKSPVSFGESANTQVDLPSPYDQDLYWSAPALGSSDALDSDPFVNEQYKPVENGSLDSTTHGSHEQEAETSGLRARRGLPAMSLRRSERLRAKQ